MPDEQLRRCIEVFGCDFYLLFGQTEMSPTATMFRPELQLSHAGPVGTPVVNVQVAIMDKTGRLLPQGGEQGEIVNRGPHTVTEYLDAPAATERFGKGRCSSFVRTVAAKGVLSSHQTTLPPHCGQ